MKETNYAHAFETFYIESFDLPTKKTVEVKFEHEGMSVAVQLTEDEAKELVVKIASQLSQSDIIDCLHDALKNSRE